MIRTTLLACSPVLLAVFVHSCTVTTSQPSQPPPAKRLATTRPATTQPGVSFFGLNAGEHVKRVVFVCDRCGSMVRNFDYVKEELNRLIGGLRPEQEFSIVLFSVAMTELRIAGQRGLFGATPENIKAAKEWVNAIVCQSMTGRVRSADAVRRALTMLAGQPGVIFLLTDSLLFDQPEKVIADLNAKKTARIYTIGFVDQTREGEKLLTKIAADNGGEYRFVSEEELGR